MYICAYKSLGAIKRLVQTLEIAEKERNSDIIKALSVSVCLSVMFRANCAYTAHGAGGDWVVWSVTGRQEEMQVVGVREWVRRLGVRHLDLN